MAAATEDWREGAADFRAARRAWAEIGGRNGARNSQANLTTYELEMGDARDARVDLEALRAMDPQVAPPEDLDRRLRYETGDPAGALPSYAHMWEHENRHGLDRAWEAQYYANTLQAVDRLDEAHRLYDESVRSLGDLGVITVYVDAVRDLTRLDLLEGRVAEAEAIARAAVARARATGTIYWTVEVEPALAWAHALEGRTAEATREMAEVLALPDYEDVYTPLAVAQAALVVDERAGRDPAAAVARLEKLRARAEALDNREVALEARLALSQHALVAGDADRARPALAAIEREAGVRGLAFLARRARESVRGK
jgi:hypothetical protein